MALIHTGSTYGLDMTIVKAAQQVNTNQQKRFAKRITDYFQGKEGETVLAVWGLAFKAKTDDVRESAAINCVRKFIAAGMKIRAYDPQANDTAMAALDSRIETFTDGYAALDNADALVILTDWQEFRNPDLEAIAARLKKPVIFDGRNLYDPADVRQQGFEYYSIGRT
jgi:UDPglucose 6-dehydrogenase